MGGIVCARLSRAAALLLLGCLQAAGASAATLDWDSNPWPGPTTLVHTYFGVGGIDITVTVEDLDGVLTTVPDASPAAPNTNTFLDTPLNGGEDQFFVRANGNNGPNPPTVRVDFSPPNGVTDVAFRLFDIDADAALSQWRDVIDVMGFAVGGGTINPTNVQALTGSPSWTWTSGTPTITGQPPNQGGGNDNATAAITFAGPITGFMFIYANGTTPTGNQWIAMSDLDFEPVPEPSGAALALLAILAGAGLRRRLPRG